MRYSNSITYAMSGSGIIITRIEIQWNLSWHSSRRCRRHLFRISTPFSCGPRWRRGTTLAHIHLERERRSRSMVGDIQNGLARQVFGACRSSSSWIKLANVQSQVVPKKETDRETQCSMDYPGHRPHGADKSTRAGLWYYNIPVQ